MLCTTETDSPVLLSAPALTASPYPAGGTGLALRPSLLLQLRMLQTTRPAPTPVLSAARATLYPRPLQQPCNSQAAQRTGQVTMAPGLTGWQACGAV
jgi:hypothetical protein